MSVFFLILQWNFIIVSSTRMSDEVDRFIESPEYEYAKQAGERVLDTLMHEGVFEAWVELLIALAPQGETHAYRGGQMWCGWMGVLNGFVLFMSMGGWCG